MWQFSNEPVSKMLNYSTQIVLDRELVLYTRCNAMSVCVCVRVCVVQMAGWQSSTGQTRLQTAAVHIWLPGSRGNWRAKAESWKTGRRRPDILPSLAVPNISHKAAHTAGKLKPLLANWLFFSFFPLFLAFLFYIIHLGDTERRDGPTGWKPDFKLIVFNSFHH